MNRNDKFGGASEPWAARHEGSAFQAGVLGSLVPFPRADLYEVHQLVVAFAAGIKLGIFLAECKAQKRSPNRKLD